MLEGDACYAKMKSSCTVRGGQKAQRERPRAVILNVGGWGRQGPERVALEQSGRRPKGVAVWTRSKETQRENGPRKERV